MKEIEFSEVIRPGYETAGVEFKSAGPRTDKQLFAKVVRAVLAMAKRRNGGLVIVAVEESQGSLTPTGLPQQDLGSWNHDAVTGAIAGYADPYVSLRTEIIEYQGK
jgi:hypothetical protein